MYNVINFSLKALNKFKMSRYFIVLNIKWSKVLLLFIFHVFIYYLFIFRFARA